VIVVAWLCGVYVLWILCIILEMGTSFIIVWFHYKLIIKVIRGMESSPILEELVFVFDLRKHFMDSG
jgi:hypothetical protein